MEHPWSTRGAALEQPLVRCPTALGVFALRPGQHPRRAEKRSVSSEGPDGSERRSGHPASDFLNAGGKALQHGSSKPMQNNCQCHGEAGNSEQMRLPGTGRPSAGESASEPSGPPVGQSSEGGSQSSKKPPPKIVTHHHYVPCSQRLGVGRGSLSSVQSDIQVEQITA
eukprot:Skav225213  [mRNA]  locus=scaffold1041:237088:243406:- [translate_table: standard]